MSHYWLLFACHTCGHDRRKRGRCAACGAVWWPIAWCVECRRPVQECSDRCDGCGGHLAECACDTADEQEREASETCRK